MLTANSLKRQKNIWNNHKHHLTMTALFTLLSFSIYAAEPAARVEPEADHDSEEVLPAPEQDFETALNEAQKAYDDARYEEGLKILRPFEYSHAGQVEYDYLMGQCALETRRLNLAISAFQRVLTIDPAFAAARIELARAYYSKGVLEHSRGAFEQARAEFNNVLALEPPKAIKKSIQQYLKTISKYLKVRHIKASMYLELGGGFDTNANSGPSTKHFSFYDPFYNTTTEVELTRDSQRSGSGFAQASAGLKFVLPLFTNNFDLFIAGRAHARSHEKAHYLDHESGYGQVGFNHYGKTNKKTASINFNKTSLDGSRYADEFYGQLEWAQRINDSNLLSMRLLGGEINYEHDYHSRSTNGGRLALEWTNLTKSVEKKSRQFMLLAGRDDYRNCHDYCQSVYRRDISGFRIASSSNISDRSRTYRSIYFEYSNFDERFFSERRIDRRLEMFFGVSTQLSKNWQIRPELHIIYNNSTINIYDATRSVGSLNLKWEF